MKETDQATNKALKQNETGNLISASKVEGTEIYDRNHEHIGQVSKVMIDKTSGRVAYAVVEIGGFLGLGSQLRALPWSILKYDTSDDGYVVNADKDLLKKTPEYSEANLGSRDWGERIHNYFGTPPYWM